ncbi:MAG: GNAT family N-acetyltransferase [Acidobacteria bacterium]|nr:GNAT family N-acetyltransferase [Acidobacteriota bacterium]
MSSPTTVEVRNTCEADFDGVIGLCRRVYPTAAPWTRTQLASHQAVFPEGQFVAVQGDRIVGMAASLIVLWDDYDAHMTWRGFTDHGLFTNHDPARGRTLYGAEVMVDPEFQGEGIGSQLYEARRGLVIRLGLRRIRAGARLRGYHQVADRMSPEAYVDAVERGELIDPTLSFQLNRGFRVMAVVSGYLKGDPESMGFAAVIEWINPAAAPEIHVPEPPR